jgi:predicted TIM-barrel enzyme
MLFSYRRTRRWEFILLSFVYAGSGVAAGASLQWWPLMAGFVTAWLLKFAGYDTDKIARQHQEKLAREAAAKASEANPDK